MLQSENALTLNNLEIFNEGKRLFCIDTLVKAGAVLTIMGPSGVGKSTLLRAISGHLSAPFHFTGNVMLNGSDLSDKPAHLRRVGVMFQDALLFEHMTVEENIAFAMPKGKFGSKGARHEYIAAMLENVGLQGLQKRAVSALSGGQQARISLLRTLSSEPNAILLDEPFSKLDSNLREQIRRWTFEQLKQQNIPAVLVTHDSDDAVSAGGEIIELTTC